MFKNIYLYKICSPEGAQRIPGSDGCICDYGRGDSASFLDVVPEYAALLPGYGYLRSFSL